MGINTNNDWDPLEEIIVGTADNARVPNLDVSTRSFSYANYDLELIEGLEGPSDQWVIDEANEDLDRLAKMLKSLGVKVIRPKSIDHSKKFSSPDWKTTGWYTYCPRDLLLPLNNLVIECPSPMRARQYETTAYRDVLYNALEDGTEWIAAPRPRLLDDSYQFYNLKKPTLLNKEIIFDAPNIVRMGKDLLYQVSNSGNLLGFQWLKTILEPRGYRLHLSKGLYSYAQRLRVHQSLWLSVPHLPTLRPVSTPSQDLPVCIACALAEMDYQTYLAVPHIYFRCHTTLQVCLEAYFFRLSQSLSATRTFHVLRGS